MDVDKLAFATGKNAKRKFVEALKEFTQLNTPPSKRPPIVPNAIDTIRVEVNKVTSFGNKPFLRADHS